MRSDAESNRRRTIAAAQQVFGERGVSASLTEVAERADVGVATLYRRFPTRQALVEEAFEDAFARYDASADEALVEGDPWPIHHDVTPEDLPVLPFALAGILDATRDDLPDAWRRHLGYFLEGCRLGASEPAVPLPQAPTPRQLQKAMLRSGRRRQQR